MDNNMVKMYSELSSSPTVGAMAAGNDLNLSNCVWPTSGFAYYGSYRDKGKEAFAIVKALRDKKLMKVNTIDDFINAMDVILHNLG